MTVPVARNVGAPTASRAIPKGMLEHIEVDGFACVKVRYEPGWRWSESLGPQAGADICQIRHTGFALAGRLRVRMDDGTEAEVGPGDVFVVPPGHDGWVVGAEAFEALDFAPEMQRFFDE